MKWTIIFSLILVMSQSSAVFAEETEELQPPQFEQTEETSQEATSEEVVEEVVEEEAPVENEAESTETAESEEPKVKPVTEIADQPVEKKKPVKKKPEVYSAKANQVDVRKVYDGEISAIQGDRVVAEFYSPSTRVDRYFYVYDRFGNIKGKVVLAGQYGIRDLVKPVKTDRLLTGWYLKSKLKVDYNAKLKAVRLQLEKAKKNMVQAFKNEQKKMKAKFRKKRVAVKEAEAKKIEKEVQKMHQELKQRKKELNADLEKRVFEHEQAKKAEIDNRLLAEENARRAKIDQELNREEATRRQALNNKIEKEKLAQMVSLNGYMAEVRKQRLRSIESEVKSMGAELAQFEQYLNEKKRAVQQAQKRLDSVNQKAKSAATPPPVEPGRQPSSK